eukprot:CAMPEP_0119104924 /NCGR_PEP_ID=MMETSP1180-20130426/3006_1 /TAXON_ID=3052 ORGANISM="Chlamydomonas cf sp, Strain CCMP681" /NCGR_SAMPLE_ID=MMETSP1180 /ASSEMBLY_ACC=CAM_ASM_000741 /LENGTH=48 /DNA_ID= /DNA_START= /DNA_END= /DNA_ORIENTATION=
MTLDLISESLSSTTTPDLLTLTDSRRSQKDNPMFQTLGVTLDSESMSA